MGFYTGKLAALKKEFNAKYDPTTAFGDQRLIDIKAEIDRLEADMEGKEECERCEGWGEVECDECGAHGDCPDCDSGLVDV